METVSALMSVLDLRLAGLPRGPSIGNCLEILRTRRGWSTSATARRAGISSNAVSPAEHDGARADTVEALLSVLAAHVRARKPERARWEAGRRDCRWTPPEVFDAIERALGKIDLDPAGDAASPVRAGTIYTEDGLSKPWFGVVYCNPPHSGAAAFIRRAHAAWLAKECRAVALLLPVQTHLVVFHELIVRTADVFFLRNRIRFISPDGHRDTAPFPSMLALFGADDDLVERVLAEFRCVHLARTAKQSAS
jgi:transcriptional regulator with XRE-family HTH domain